MGYLQPVMGYLQPVFLRYVTIRPFFSRLCALE